MYMESWQQSNFIKFFLGPTFKNNGISTRIIIYDHNWSNTNYPLSILNDATAKQYVDGSAWHCYGGDKNNPSIVHDAHPDRHIYFTECSGGEWSKSFEQNLGWNAQMLFIGQLRAWSRSVLLWNMALDENFGPRFAGLGGCSNCRGVIRTNRDGSFTKNVEFYILGHFSKFVKPGAVVIDSSTYASSGLESIAMKNPDGSIVVVVLNASWDDAGKDFHIKIGNDIYQYRGLRKRSVATFITQ